MCAVTYSGIHLICMHVYNRHAECTLYVYTCRPVYHKILLEERKSGIHGLHIPALAKTHTNRARNRVARRLDIAVCFRFNSVCFNMLQMSCCARVIFCFVSHARHRNVPTKRGDVAYNLVTRFASLLWFWRFWSHIKGLVLRVFCCRSEPHAQAIGLNSSETFAERVGSPAFFLGHTRFATSSGNVSIILLQCMRL